MFHFWLYAIITFGPFMIVAGAFFSLFMSLFKEWY